MPSPLARRNLECDTCRNRVQNPGYILSSFNVRCPLVLSLPTPSSCSGDDTTAVGTMSGH